MDVPVAESGVVYPLGRVHPVAPLAVADGVSWVRLPLPFALDHVNAWLVGDTGERAIVDTGYGCDETRAAWRRILAHGAPVTRIVATHYHPDHVGNAAWLAAETGARVAMTKSEYLTAHAIHAGVGGYDGDAVAAFFMAHGLDAEQARRCAARAQGYRRGVPELPTQVSTLVDGDTVELGGIGWRVVCGRGHSPEHASLHCAPLGLLISGDMLLPRISTNVAVWPVDPDDDPLARFLESLSALATLPADTLVLPSHGQPFRGIAARVAELRAHHDERLAVLRAGCDTPISAAQAVPLLFERELDTHQWFFAMGEAIAHLNHLWRRGTLVRAREDDGVWRFRTAC